MIACAVLADLGGWPGRLELSGVADEKTGGFGGAKWLAEQGIFAAGKQDHVIIPEPFSPHRICVGHRGVWWGEIETFGRVGHGSMPFLGECAVRHMGAILHALETEYIPAIEARVTDAPVTPEPARRSSLNIAALHGGQPEGADGFLAPNVPDRCRLVFDRRLIREEDPAEAKAELRALLDRTAAARGFRYELRDLFEIAPCHTDESGPVVSATSSAVADVLRRNPEIVCSPGTYDQRYFDRVAGVKDVIAYGPGTLDLAHQPDEHVAVSDLVDAAKVMAVTAWRLLHG
jgi:succinyl-diaminopimelate desuccinylase